MSSDTGLWRTWLVRRGEPGTIGDGEVKEVGIFTTRHNARVAGDAALRIAARWPNAAEWDDVCVLRIGADFMAPHEFSGTGSVEFVDGKPVLTGRPSGQVHSVFTAPVNGVAHNIAMRFSKEEADELAAKCGGYVVTRDAYDYEGGNVDE